MYIRQTRTANKSTGEAYFTFRLVRGERIGGRVRQITVLNLGRNFAIKQEDWPMLCLRLEQLLQPQDVLLGPDCAAHIERAAQRYAAQLVARAPVVEQCAQVGSAPAAGTPQAAPPDFQDVDIDSLQQTQPRSVGVEHVALHALGQLGLVDKLAELGINGVQRAAILGNVIGRMAVPGSERATWEWLQTHSALGELLEAGFDARSHMMYRASDLLMRHRSAIEDHLFGAAQTLFGFGETVTFYDLTNTYFEGEEHPRPLAAPVVRGETCDFGAFHHAKCFVSHEQPLVMGRPSRSPMRSFSPHPFPVPAQCLFALFNPYKPRYPHGFVSPRDVRAVCPTGFARRRCIDRGIHPAAPPAADDDTAVRRPVLVTIPSRADPREVGRGCRLGGAD